MTPELLIAHCVDTEGPLDESWSATFECIRKSLGYNFDESPEKLDELRSGYGLDEPMKTRVVDFLSRRNYKRNWQELEEMLAELFSVGWREKHLDDFGNPYVFSWFVVDLVGNTHNPRSRSLGFHQIYNRYKDYLGRPYCERDRIYWHYHPPSISREAHKTSNNFSTTGYHLEILARRVIDHLDFPVSFRPGSHTERPDINFFLEQWIPFDFGNQSYEESDNELIQRDLQGGRFGDWRRAPRAWGAYHPAFHDYQSLGNMNRWIARCLNIDSRVRVLTDSEVIAAFDQAATNGKALLCFTNHDEREMRPAIEDILNRLRGIQQRDFPHVKIRFVNAVEGIRKAEGLKREVSPSLKVYLNGNRLEIEASKPLWGPQPFFCLKLLSGDYVFENLDFGMSRSNWSFTFDDDSVEIGDVDLVGLASHDRVGNTFVTRGSLQNGPSTWPVRTLNDQDWLDE